ncbi:MORN motif protein [Pelomyxa schiedti]|nr:MORN motif protein [Pelomyxa schiedti]
MSGVDRNVRCVSSLLFASLWVTCGQVCVGRAACNIIPLWGVVSSVVGDTSRGDGGTYTGRLVNNKRDGWGRCSWTCGDTYEGQWSHDEKHGRGLFKWPDGGTYDGEWYQDLRDGWGTRGNSTHGGGGGGWFEGLLRGNHWRMGTWHHHNGADVRHGEWAWNDTTNANEVHGWGVQRTVSFGAGAANARTGAGRGEVVETVYEGEWDRDQWHGWGMWRSPATGDIYYGQFGHGKRSGTGRMLFCARGGQGEGWGGGGGSYDGEWRDDMFHGRGVRLWANGDRYEGDWMMGKENGSGTKRWAHDGTAIEGIWEMGVIKSGTKRWPNGDEFVGRFTMDGACGEGMAKLKGASEVLSFEGTLTNGMFQGNEHVSYCLGYGDLQMEANLRSKIHELVQELHQLRPQFEHTLKHIQRGVWVTSISPCNEVQTKLNHTTQEEEASHKIKCEMKTVSVTLERHNITFLKPVCSLCPLDKVVKMEVEKLYGVDENHQALSFSLTGNPGEELSLSGTTSTLLQLLHESSSVSAGNTIPVIRVRLIPVMNISDSDMRHVGTLGIGSYGTVDKCIHTPSGREVAVKRMHELIVSKTNVEKFRLEAEIVSGLRHPNIVKCIGIITRAERLLIVSEVMCCSLRQLLTKVSVQQKQLSLNETVAIALNVARGMDSLHRQNYMHRDLSSNNILFDSNGTPKICDFGVSHEMVSQQQIPRTRTKGPGTPVYMSPQMYTTHYSLGGDMWSFGILLTEILNGHFVDSTLASLPLQQQANFMTEQKRLLPKPDVDEVNRVCCESSELEIAHCLSRRNASLNAVEHLMHSTPDGTTAPRAAADLFLLVVQSCLSIQEKHRVPFTVIVKLLFCCCTTISSHTTTGVQVTDDQVNNSITQWLLSLTPFIHSALCSD